LQLGKYGVVWVGLKLHLVSDPLAAQQADKAQSVQLFFQGAGGGLRLAGQLAQVHFLVRLHEQQSQHFAPVLVGEEQLRQGIICFQNRNECFLFENELCEETVQLATI